MTDEKKIRVEFEKHLRDNNGYTDEYLRCIWDVDRYRIPDIQVKWITWQAALAARPDVNQESWKHLQEKLEEIRATLAECDESIEYMSEYDIPLCLPDRVKSALLTAGELQGEMQKMIERIAYLEKQLAVDSYDDGPLSYMSYADLKEENDKLSELLATRTNPSQELMEALNEVWIYSDDLPPKIVERIRKALAKYKASESAGFTEEELIEAVDNILDKPLDSYNVIVALKQCGALKVRE